MDILVLKDMLMWCSLINLGLLIYWAIMLLVAPNFIFRMQSKWLPLSRDQFNLAMYLFLGMFKLFVIVFNLVPYCALVIIS